MIGHVKRVVADRGFGFLKARDGREFFFHVSGLVNIAFVEVREGMEVSFEEVADSTRGPRAASICVL